MPEPETFGPLVKTRQEFVDAYHAAARTEEDLWTQMKGHGPGQPGFNKELWDKWLRAVGQTTAASKALREAISTPKRSDER
jgi:hypothetical protein